MYAINEKGYFFIFFNFLEKDLCAKNMILDNRWCLG
jgi:hypothetical protein